MIVLDTHVLSELMRREPDESVRKWTDSVGRLHTTALTLAEIGHGIARLPQGRRKHRLAEEAAIVFADFGDVVLPFDAESARWYAGIVADRERVGHPIHTADAQIAAICASRGATLATRNTSDFVETGISIVDPWAG